MVPLVRCAQQLSARWYADAHTQTSHAQADMKARTGTARRQTARSRQSRFAGAEQLRGPEGLDHAVIGLYVGPPQQVYTSRNRGKHLRAPPKPGSGLMPMRHCRSLWPAPAAQACSPLPGISRSRLTTTDNCLCIVWTMQQAAAAACAASATSS